jgi:hypothetical protein
LLAFLAYQAAVNFTFFILTYDEGFLWSLSYLIYGGLAFYLVANLALKNGDFLLNLSRFALLGITVLVIIAALGFGEYRFFPRYNAFFNDPNQMAYWVLCISSIVVFYNLRIGKFVVTSAIFLSAAFLIILTGSRSGTIGFAILMLGFVIGYFRITGRKLGFPQIVAFAIGILLVVYSCYFILSSDSEAASFITKRFEGIDIIDQADIRGYSRLFDHPWYMILGAGHGMESRFNAFDTEIHSTWLGLLFFYGIPGFIFFSVFLFSMLRKLDPSGILIFLAPLFYSFSTFGLRTPIFWIFLGFLYAVTLQKKRIPQSRQGK